MGLLDIILGGFLAFALYKGIKNGLFVELASLVAFFIGLYIAVKFSFLMKEAISKSLHWNSNMVQIVAFIITFALVVMGISMLAKLLTKVASIAFVGWLNKLGGGFFRLLKTVLIMGVFLNFFNKINYNHFLVKKETIDNSIFYSPIQKIAGYCYPSITSYYKKVTTKNN